MNQRMELFPPVSPVEQAIASAVCGLDKTLAGASNGDGGGELDLDVANSSSIPTEDRSTATINTAATSGIGISEDVAVLAGRAAVEEEERVLRRRGGTKRRGAGSRKRKRRNKKHNKCLTSRSDDVAGGVDVAGSDDVIGGDVAGGDADVSSCSRSVRHDDGSGVNHVPNLIQNTLDASAEQGEKC
jgi:hypothetical protein